MYTDPLIQMLALMSYQVNTNNNESLEDKIYTTINKSDQFDTHIDHSPKIFVSVQNTIWKHIILYIPNILL